MFFNFSCGSKVIHETIVLKRDRDLRFGRSLGTHYTASRYWVELCTCNFAPYTSKLAQFIINL